MKKFISAVTILTAALCLSTSVSAQAQHKVYDTAEVLSVQDETMLEELAENLALSHGVDAMICTERSLDALPEERAKSLFSSNDVGIGNSRDGILLLIWFEDDNPNYIIYQNGWADKVYTEYAAERIDELISQDIKKRDFAGAAQQLLKVSDKFMSAQEKGNPYSLDRPYRTSGDILRIWLLWVCIGAVVSCGICAALVAGMRKRTTNNVIYSAAPEKKSFAVTTQRDILLYTKISNDDGKEKLDDLKNSR